MGVPRGARELWESLANGSAANWQERAHIPPFSLQGRHAAAAAEAWNGWCDGRDSSNGYACRRRVYTEGKLKGRSRSEWPFPLNRPL